MWKFLPVPPIPSHSYQSQGSQFSTYMKFHPQLNSSFYVSPLKRPRRERNGVGNLFLLFISLLIQLY